MYRQWAALKLNLSIYRYHIAAGAATYWVGPQFLRFLEYKRVNDENVQERKIMSQLGLYNAGKYWKHFHLHPA